MLRQIFLREIDSSHGNIFFHVANNVRELKGQTAALGERFGGGIAISEDLDAHQPNHRSNAVTILLQIIESLVARGEAG